MKVYSACVLFPDTGPWTQQNPEKNRKSLVKTVRTVLAVYCTFTKHKAQNTVFSFSCNRTHHIRFYTLRFTTHPSKLLYNYYISPVCCGHFAFCTNRIEFVSSLINSAATSLFPSGSRQLQGVQYSSIKSCNSS